MRSSGLSPEKFMHAEKMIKSVVQDMPRLRARRESSAARTKEPQTVSQAQSPPKKKEDRLDKTALLERAKAVQSGVLFRSPALDSVPLPAHPERTTVPRKVESPSPAPEAPKEPASESKKRPPSTRPSSDPPEPSVKPESEDVQAYQRLVSLGMPAHREGLKFQVEPRRKRGRPPGQKKIIPQWMRDAERIALREQIPPSTSSTGYLPARYLAANLTRVEEQWICPLPMPMMMSTANPGAVQALPSEVWAWCAPQWEA